MARKPSGRISKTIGQGISRGISQKARQLGGGGSGMTPVKTTTGFDTPGVASGQRQYAKTSVSGGSGNSAEYSSREMPNPNLGELASAFKNKPPKAGKGFL